MKIIIVGGGFAGLKLARSLARKKGIEVLLIDKFNYHQFQPLFYQVATAALDASNISFPLRKVFHHTPNVHIRMALVTGLDPIRKVLETSIGPFAYDHLVIATGADTNFFGNENLRRYAFPMKSTVEALQLRHRLIQNFEDALSTEDPAEFNRLMTIVVVGGGPTGVEISGALAEMKKFVLPKDYPELDFSRMKIFLLEGSPETLSAMSEESSVQSKSYLESLGVTVRTETLVKDYDGQDIFLQDGGRIPTQTVIWAAGIHGNIPAGIDQKWIVKGNRIKVDRQNRVPGYPGLFAIGDVAYMETPLYPHGHPQVANVAIHQAETLAGNFIRMEKGNGDLLAFEYHDKGSMATVGRNLAVVDIPKPKLHFGGWIAWFVWMSFHLYQLVGVKNRIQVFINWIYNYFTYDQSLRLIFKEFYKPTVKKNSILQPLHEKKELHH